MFSHANSVYLVSRSSHSPASCWFVCLPRAPCFPKFVSCLYCVFKSENLIVMNTRDLSLLSTIILHCSDNNVDLSSTHNLTVDDIRHCHKLRGFDDIGYHYVIRTNGEIQQGREIQFVGAHCMYFNMYSIGVCYIGGRNDNGYRDTRTPEQIDSMIELVYMLLMSYPSIHVIAGHHYYNTDKLCPCMSVTEFGSQLLEKYPDLNNRRLYFYN